MNNAFKKTVLAMTAVGVVMGPIMPSIAMANEHGYQSNGVANYLDADAQEIGHNGGKNRTEKGSPYGWKAGGTFFGMLIDASEGHWGNNVLDASVNQLIIPASVQYYATSPVFYKAKINTIVAEANGFNNTAEMTTWISANLSVDYKASLVAAVEGIATDEVEEVVKAAVSQGTELAATVVGKPVTPPAAPVTPPAAPVTPPADPVTPPAAPVTPPADVPSEPYGPGEALYDNSNPVTFTVEGVDVLATEANLSGISYDVAYYAGIAGQNKVAAVAESVAGDLEAGLGGGQTINEAISQNIGHSVDALTGEGHSVHFTALDIDDLHLEGFEGGLNQSVVDAIFAGAVATGLAGGLELGQAKDAAKKAMDDTGLFDPKKVQAAYDA